MSHSQGSGHHHHHHRGSGAGAGGTSSSHGSNAAHNSASLHGSSGVNAANNNNHHISSVTGVPGPHSSSLASHRKLQPIPPRQITPQQRLQEFLNSQSLITTRIIARMICDQTISVEECLRRPVATRLAHFLTVKTHPKLQVCHVMPCHVILFFICENILRITVVLLPFLTSLPQFPSLHFFSLHFCSPVSSLHSVHCNSCIDWHILPWPSAPVFLACLCLARFQDRCKCSGPHCPGAQIRLTRLHSRCFLLSSQSFLVANRRYPSSPGPQLKRSVILLVRSSI